MYAQNILYIKQTYDEHRFDIDIVFNVHDIMMWISTYGLNMIFFLNDIKIRDIGLYIIQYKHGNVMKDHYIRWQ